MVQAIPSLQHQIDTDELARYGQEGARDFKSFVLGAWLLTEHGRLDWNWHLDCIVDHLMALAKGEIKKLAIAIPPRGLKSTFASFLFPSWVWTFAPWSTFLTASYVDSLAVRDTRRSRQLMQTAWYQEYYGHMFRFLSDQNVKGYYLNNQGGARIATSTDGSGTGEGGLYVGIDDPHNIRDVNSSIKSSTALSNTINWYDKVLSTRRNDVSESRQYIIGQRVHKHDLIGHVLEQGGWVYVSLPAEYERTRTFHSVVTNRATGKPWTDPRTEDGELLFPNPSRLPAEFLAEQKIIMGPDYDPQYNQRTHDLDTGIIRYSNIRRYELSDDGLEYILYDFGGGIRRVQVSRCQRVISEDLAVSTTDVGCYTVILLWDISPDYDAMLRQMWAVKVEGPESEALQDTVVAENRIGLHGLIMEHVGTLVGAIQRAQKKGFPVIEYKPITDKQARANSIAVYWRAGQFFLPRHAAWLAEYEAKITGFPVEPFSADYMDATSILLAMYMNLEPNIRDMYTSPELSKQDAEEIAALQELKEDNPELAKWLLEQEYGEEGGIEGLYR